jgi:radical SAM superfamily enzyme
MIVHRLTGETYRAITVAPDWSVDKIGVHNAISGNSINATVGKAVCIE